MLLANFNYETDVELLGERLGHSKYAQVFVGRLKKTNQLVAIKQYDRHRLQREGNSQHVVMEKQTLVRIGKHPLIAQLYVIDMSNYYILIMSCNLMASIAFVD